MKNLRPLSLTRWLILMLSVALLSACASVPRGAPGAAPGKAASPAQSIDPWENWNRKVFAFNDAVDEAVLKPVATAYRNVVPAMVRTGVSNFFGNIGDIWSAGNHLLQGKLSSGLEMGMRVLTNTFIGIGGILDPATEMKIERRPEDFGQTLAVWGVGNGPYIVLPLLGPSTLRDTVALPLDRYATTPSVYISDINNYVVTPLQLVSIRAELLSTTSLLDKVALDRYSFVRDAYLSRRLDQIYDGAPPMETFDDEPDAAAPKKK